MLLFQLLSSAGVAFVVATRFGAFDDEACALTLSGAATLPGWAFGFVPLHSTSWTSASFSALVSLAQVFFLIASFCMLPPIRGRGRAHLVRLLHGKEWLVAACIAVVDDPAF